MPQKDTLDDVAYTCMLVSYHRHSPQFQFSVCCYSIVSISMNRTLLDKVVFAHYVKKFAVLLI
jgi:hypothetical protein